MAGNLYHCQTIRRGGVNIIRNITLYSTGCPKCVVLKKKLAEKGIEYKENTSTEEMLALGITTVPVLCVDNELKDFAKAVSWLNNQ